MSEVVYNVFQGVVYLTFPALNKLNFIKHAVYTRLGGASSSHFGSLNVGLDLGDCPKNVKKNRFIIDKISGGILTLYLKQTHSAKVLMVQSKKMIKKTNKLYSADAIITDIPNINIAIQTADCQSVLIVDPVNKVVANIHVGWRGNVSNILKRTINSMIKYFGCKPVNMIATLSPSLGPCCAEFLNYKKEFPISFLKYKVENFNFNLWKITKEQLCKLGILNISIHYSNICTKCNTQLFFSYRQNKVTGRFASLIRICNQ